VLSDRRIGHSQLVKPEIVKLHRQAATKQPAGAYTADSVAAQTPSQPPSRCRKVLRRHDDDVDCLSACPGGEGSCAALPTLFNANRHSDRKVYRQSSHPTSHTRTHTLMALFQDTLDELLLVTTEFRM